MTRYYMENEFSENFTFQMYYNKDIYKSLHQKKKAGRAGGPTNLIITDPTDKTLFQRLDQ